MHTLALTDISENKLKLLRASSMTGIVHEGNPLNYANKQCYPHMSYDATTLFNSTKTHCTLTL